MVEQNVLDKVNPARRSSERVGCAMALEVNYWAERRSGRLSRRRAVVLGAAGLALLGATACSTARKGANSPAGQSGAQSAGGSPQTGGTLTIAQRTSATTLDPHRTTSLYTETPCGMVLSRLLRYKSGTDPMVSENRETEPDLAASVESADGVTWTVTLRPDAKFQDVAPVSGHPVEAEDIKQTFIRALAPANPGRSAMDMLDASQIQTPTSTTLVFKLKYPYAPLPNAIFASPSYGWILPREAAAGTYDPGKQMIGSGPFLLDNYTPDVAFTYRRNPNWFEHGRPYVDGLTASIIPDLNADEAQFTGGHLDISSAATTNDVPAMKRDNPKAQVLRTLPTGGREVFFQLGDPASPFQDIRLRQAFSMAVDRNALAKALYNADSLANFYAYPYFGKWNLQLEQLPANVAPYYKYDPADAKKLLQATGVADQQFKLIYQNNGGSEFDQEAGAIANMLQAIGVKIAATTIDYQKDYIDGGQGVHAGFYDKNSIVLAGPSSFDDVDGFLYGYFDSQATNGLTRLKNSTVDSMIDNSRKLLNPDERQKSLIQLQQYIAGQVFTLAALPRPYTYTFVQARVQSFQYALSYGVGAETYSKLWLSA